MSVLKYTLIVRHPDTGVATALLAGQSVPKWAAALVDKGNLEGSAPAEDDESPYSGLKVADLKAEVEKRNTDREDDAKVSPESDKKADLIAALVADDESQA